MNLTQAFGPSSPELEKSYSDMASKLLILHLHLQMRAGGRAGLEAGRGAGAYPLASNGPMTKPDHYQSIVRTLSVAGEGVLRSRSFFCNQRELGWWPYLIHIAESAARCQRCTTSCPTTTWNKRVNVDMTYAR